VRPLSQNICFVVSHRDFGSFGPTLIQNIPGAPGTGLILTNGKVNIPFILNASSLGGPPTTACVNYNSVAFLQGLYEPCDNVYQVGSWSSGELPDTGRLHPLCSSRCM
jgi:hypothetical protein